MPVRKTTAAGCLVLLVLALPMGAGAQVAPRDPDSGLPQVLRAYKSSHPDAWTFGRAWKNRAAAVRRSMRDPGSAARVGSTAVAGRFHVPVFAVSFANTVEAPWPASELESALFDWETGSLSDFYLEISRGKVLVEGSVRGWHKLPGDDTWYEGSSAGTNPFDARIGELIRDTLQQFDSTIDFGAYDNDGPDGIPNSGDDDGYVDFVAFVHPEVGAECGGTLQSIWSHRWRYSAWAASGGVPYVTGDQSASGGKILVDDYTIQPAIGCDGVSQIEIGVFCHEFGHAFGLPDLYDTNGGSAGLGHWCLMASGNWNDPASPAHMSAWAKAQLGWVDVMDVDWRGATVAVEPVIDSGQVYRLKGRADRWRRRDDCVIAGDWSLAVGLDAVASNARGWPAEAGYGNGWYETVVRDFAFDGTGPVTLDFDYAVHTESGFDFVFLFVEQNDKETILAVFDGEHSGELTFDLTPALSEGPYRIGFRFRSDVGWSNEDGKFTCSCAAFRIDDVSVTGGGVDYFSDFESHRAGWYQPRDDKDNPVNEYWLVENRQVQGFDSALHSEGLLVYHVDEDVMESSLKNSGGSSGHNVRGVVVEEADGKFDLLSPTGNRGDAGDPWPGSVPARFDSGTIPNALNNSGLEVGVRLEVLGQSDGAIQLRVWAGEPAPSLADAAPDTLVPGLNEILIRGTGLQPGVRVGLVRAGSPRIEASATEWLDFDLVRVEFDGSEIRPGSFGVLVENPDGQTFIREDAVYQPGEPVDSPPASIPSRFALAQNSPNPFNPSTTIRYEMPRDAHIDLAVFDLRGRRIATLYRGPAGIGYHTARWDGRDERGRAVASGLYFARLVGPGFTATRKMMLAR